ncbi:UPF0158 family protein [Streptomyces sp. NPDC102360]|uniref:UPF0158 family protein n=1 Tax=Streptomyces sp. NPDC102360 TaxID=3366160 RepID=UPI0037F6ADA9
MSGDWNGSELARLRAAVYTADGPTLVGLLTAHDPQPVLQSVGDALRVAVVRGVPGAAKQARVCVTLLRSRDWPGDETLADDLARAGDGRPPAPGLRAVAVDLEELTGLRDGDPVDGAGYLDLDSGECWPAAVLDDFGGEPGADEAPDRWLPVPCAGSRDAYRDMHEFTDGLTDALLARRLEDALAGRGAFRRFKDVLTDHPDLREQYFWFAGERGCGRARAWLAGEGIRVVHRLEEAA